MKQTDFVSLVWGYYDKHGRELPWRRTADPYAIMVSEIMLQQTQVSRVIPKFLAFLQTFPTVYDLADAPLSEVLKAWSGLGYNRRAKYLHESAKVITQKYHGTFPQKLDDLTALPGIGVNTAGAILAYAYNIPVVFIETNIRTVYIHHFFADKSNVTDKELLPIIKKTVDAKNPREWYWALMDYGSFLKQTVGNLSRSSKHYAKQTPFEGSKRKVRGAILRSLASRNLELVELEALTDDNRTHAILKDLVAEGLISEKDGSYQLG